MRKDLLDQSRGKRYSVDSDEVTSSNVDNDKVFDGVQSMDTLIQDMSLSDGSLGDGIATPSASAASDDPDKPASESMKFSAAAAEAAAAAEIIASSQSDEKKKPPIILIAAVAVIVLGIAIAAFLIIDPFAEERIDFPLIHHPTSNPPA